MLEAVKVSVLARISIAVIKDWDQKSGEERIYFVYTSILYSIIKASQTRNSSKVGKLEAEAREEHYLH